MRASQKKEADALSYRTAMLVTEMKIFLSGDGFYRCPRCRITLCREFVSYCDRCGQKLNWRKYNKVTLIYAQEKTGDAQ